MSAAHRFDKRVAIKAKPCWDVVKAPDGSYAPVK
jgi:hypothetical protein